jgi:hypothetical protein
MTAHLKLRIHITEPWDFARETGVEELIGWTTDYADPENEEWEVLLDHSYKFHDVKHGRVLLSPRYVHEHLSRIMDALVGFPVRIAHRMDGDWHFALAGMATIRHEHEETKTEGQ